MQCKNGVHDIDQVGRDKDGSCSGCRRARVARARRKTAAHTRAAKRGWHGFTLPASVWIDGTRPDVESRSARIDKAMKLARRAERAGETRTAWNYFVFADTLGRGIFIPSDEHVMAVLGHRL